MTKMLLGVRVTNELNSEFRRFISEKYGRYEQGQLSYEVSEALKHWIKIHTGTQTSLLSTPPNPTPRVSQVFVAIKQYLLQKYFQELNPGAVVPALYLKEAIAQVRGSDKRTVVKWMTVFGNFHLIKYLTSATWELM